MPGTALVPGIGTSVTQQNIAPVSGACTLGGRSCASRNQDASHALHEVGAEVSRGRGLGVGSSHSADPGLPGQTLQW